MLEETAVEGMFRELGRILEVWGSGNARGTGCFRQRANLVTTCAVSRFWELCYESLRA